MNTTKRCEAINAEEKRIKKDTQKEMDKRRIGDRAVKDFINTYKAQVEVQFGIKL